MVYCSLKHDYEDRAVYSFGATIDDMTGELVIHKDMDIEIVCEPKRYHVTANWLAKLLTKYQTDFRKGIFKKQLAYEC